MEKRLLVVAQEVHTESGKHAMQLESWTDWMKRNGVEAVSVDQGKRQLESAALSIGATLSSLPWRG